MDNSLFSNFVVYYVTTLFSDTDLCLLLSLRGSVKSQTDRVV